MSDELNPTLEVGDVVALVSGGPGMAITRIERSGICYVAWFDGMDHLLEAKIPKECLRITDGILREDEE